MNKKIYLAAFILMAGCLFYISAAHAQVPSSIVDTSASGYAQGNYGVNDFLILAIRVSKIVLGLVGSLSLVMFIYGGFMFLISAGSADAVGKAKKIIVAAVIGLVIVFSSFLIVKFVLSSMGLTWNGEAINANNEPVQPKPQSMLDGAVINS